MQGPDSKTSFQKQTSKGHPPWRTGWRSVEYGPQRESGCLLKICSLQGPAMEKELLLWEVDDENAPTFPCFFSNHSKLFDEKDGISRATRVVLVEKVEACTKFSTVAPPPLPCEFEVFRSAPTDDPSGHP